MDKPLLRLNHPRVQRFFGGGEMNIRRERHLLHIISSGSTYLSGSDRLILQCNYSRSFQDMKLWLFGNYHEPYPNTNFNWEVLYA